MAIPTSTRLALGVLLLALLAPIARAQDPAPAARPNVLLCIADDWSFGHSSAAGCAWVATPAFDRVAQKGLRFVRAYTPNAKCAPSRACLLTGRNSWQLGDACNHVCRFPLEYPTFVEALRDAGYRAGFTGKGWGPGVAQNADGSARELTGRRHAARTSPPPTSGIADNDYAANFADFLDEAPDGEPWCFWLGTLEPHRAFEAGSGAKLTGRTPDAIDRVPPFWPDTEAVRMDMLDYALEVEHFDRHVGRALDELERRGQLANTIVIVTSDHGMAFPRCKGQAYEMSNHVPLAVMWSAGITAPGRTVEDYVSLIDIAPTLLEAARLEATVMAPSPGRSLFDVLEADRGGWITPSRDHVLVGKERHDVGRPGDAGYPIRGIVAEDTLVLRNFHPERWPAGNPESGYLNCDGGPTKTEILEARRRNEGLRHWQLCFGGRPLVETYDLRTDPFCIENLAGQADHANRQRRLTDRMMRLLVAQGDPRALGEGTVFDAIEYTAAGQRDFYARFTRGEPLRAGWVSSGDFEAQRLDLSGRPRRADGDPDEAEGDLALWPLDTSNAPDIARTATRDELLRAAARRLLALQHEDGAWPYEGTWKVDGEIPAGFRIGSTSLVVSTLLYALPRGDDAAQTAIGRAIDRVLEELRAPSMAPNVDDRFDPCIWGHVYALEMLCRVDAADRAGSADRAERVRAALPELVAALRDQELEGGGWNYAHKDRHATFLTAAGVQALLWARSRGVPVDAARLDRAGSALRRSRAPGGFYAYAGDAGPELPPNGAAARSAACDVALLLLGERGSAARLPRQFAAFARHWHELDARRGQPGHHVPPFGIAPYYFFHGHAAHAIAVRFQPEAVRADRYRWIENRLRVVMDADGTWNDRVFAPCASACTAFAIQALLGEEFPLPPAR